MCHCSTDTHSLCREEWAHGSYAYISHITWALCRETQRTTKFFFWLYKPDGEGSVTAISEREFLCELLYISICFSNGYSKQKWLYQDGKIHKGSLRGPLKKPKKYSSFGPTYNQLYQYGKKDRDFCASYLERHCLNQNDSHIYMRLPGQQMTVKVTLFLCSFSMGTSAEWLIPTVDSPFTATIISPHLKNTKKKITKW